MRRACFAAVALSITKICLICLEKARNLQPHEKIKLFSTKRSSFFDVVVVASRFWNTSDSLRFCVNKIVLAATLPGIARHDE